MAMFINHSCDANCETSEIRGRVWIKSIRPIAAGEEITYDYCLYDGGDDEAICNCGAKKCRGTMYSKGRNPPPQAAPRKRPHRFKIYILDEAHQITDAAFNALLKTLEEPPAHVIFMMATTEPENIPQTIRSRCQHFSFHAVKFDDILAQLRMIATLEEVDAEDAALALLAEAGDGSMRDALSIMDQAIASAPLEKGRAVLSSAQIRELMGSVPNAVFERLLEAVAAGQSAELMEQLNLLVNAGHSPSSLARQMVRYLRNALMAKLGGEQTELLQISGDERARAARTALLFTEEELTRNLQIVLRTFDDLNYRQEQRFHLELGLLKLIHAQRLLPLEELLSGAASGGGRTATPSASSRSAVPSRPASASSVLPPTSNASPFEPASGTWRTAAPSSLPTGSDARNGPVPTSKSLSASVISMEPAALNPIPRPSAATVSEPAAHSFTAGSPFSASADPTSSNGAHTIAKEDIRSAAAGADAAMSSAQTLAPSVESLRHAIGSALVDAGYVSAAQLLGSGAWNLEGSSLRIEVPSMSKKMLSLTINAAAEKIIRQELQRMGAPTRFMVIPGEGAASTSSPIVAAPMAGSIQETALGNPLVQRAREIFKAEVRSVVDLRQK
jgi:DNA polymerase-3 subunit gamma/tau